MTAVPARNGFSLVEMLVALSLFALMAGAGTLLLAGAASADARATSLADDTARLLRLRALLAADLAQAAARPWRDGEGRLHPALSSGDGGLVTLVRAGWSNPDGAPRASLQRVRWEVADGKIIRRTAPMLDGADWGPPTVMLDGVASARLRLLGRTGWQDGWAGADPAALPRAAELRLSGPQAGQLRQLFALNPQGGAP